MVRHMAAALVCALGAATAYANAQACPSSGSEVANLNPFSACVVTPYLGLTAQQAAVRIATDEDEKCISEKNACPSAIPFNDCPSTTASLMQVLVPPAIQNSNLLQCPNFFVGYPEYCNRPFGELVTRYCPDPPLLPLPAILGIIAGGLFLILLTIFVCWRTRNSMMLDREIEDAVAFNRPIKNAMPPPSNPAQAGFPEKSRYMGVEWNQSAGGWDAIYKTQHVREWLGTFSTQEQAAKRYDQKVKQLLRNGAQGLALNFNEDEPKERAASYQSSPGSGFQAPAYAASSYDSTPYQSPAAPQIAPPPGMSSMRDPFDPDRERHMAELIDFYRYHDPDRTDVEQHVQALFEKYRFKGIARAVLRKYGVLPPGWTNEYDATRSIAMSVAAKFFAPSSTTSGQFALAPSQSGAIARDPAPNF